MKLSVAILATWFVAAWLYYKLGAQLVQLLGGWRTDANGEPSGFLAKQAACFWCTTLWVSLPMAAIALSPAWLALLPFALGGGVLLLSGGGRILWHAQTQ